MAEFDKAYSAPTHTGVDVIAFQCRNPIHRAHYELFTRALNAPEVRVEFSPTFPKYIVQVTDGAVVLVHPTCGPTQDDDIPGIVRYKTYEELQKEVRSTWQAICLTHVQVNNPRIRWAYLPYSMHMAGPREAIQHMIIRKNYGCTHFIIGRGVLNNPHAKRK
jgi:sulfate adenylyltransferase